MKTYRAIRHDIAGKNKPKIQMKYIILRKINQIYKFINKNLKY